MTMTSEKQRGYGSQTGFGSNQQVDTIVLGIEPSEINAIQLADGWHTAKNCELVQFAVGTSHSPASPGKLYPGLRYQNENGQQVVTSFRNILSLSNEQARLASRGQGQTSGS